MIALLNLAFSANLTFSVTNFSVFVQNPNFKKNNSLDNNENSFDRHAIKAIKQRTDRGLPLEQVIGHLPKEISRFIKFILIHGAQVTVKIIDVNYR